MITRTLKIRAARDSFLGGTVEIWIYEQGNDGHLAAGEPIVIKPIANDIVPVPTMKIPKDTAQELMDELWRAGLRPSEGSGSAGQLASVQYHLEDMRKLVFK